MQPPEEPRWISTDGSEVLVADLHTPYNRLDYWFPRLRELDVRVPETFVIDLDPSGRGFPTVDANEVRSELDARGWDRAFVRSMYKHAELDPRAGSFVPRPDPETIQRTVESLVAQHERMDMPLGGSLAFREWLDFDYSPCAVSAHNRHEIRFFVDRGDVLYHFPTADELADSNLDCDALYSYVREMLESGIDAPIEGAELVAAAFDEYSWHVDFDLTSHGTWYCVDMGINGVYFNGREQRWMNISQHEADSVHSPEARLGEGFPASDDDPGGR